MYWYEFLVPFGPFKGRTLGDVARAAPDAVYELKRHALEYEFGLAVQQAIEAIIARKWYNRPKDKARGQSRALANYKAAALTPPQCPMTQRRA